MELEMTKYLVSVSAALLTAGLLAAPAAAQTKSTPPATKMSQAQCTSLWNKLDAAKSGSVSETASASYVTDFKSVDTNSDGKLSQAEFTAGCGKGLVHDTASTGAGSGASGSGASGSGTAPKK
jgi:hypothetical protein